MLGRGFFRAALCVAVGTRQEGPVPGAAMGWGFCTWILTGSQTELTPQTGDFWKLYFIHILGKFQLWLLIQFLDGSQIMLRHALLYHFLLTRFFVKGAEAVLLIAECSCVAARSLPTPVFPASLCSLSSFLSMLPDCNFPIISVWERRADRGYYGQDLLSCNFKGR